MRSAILATFVLAGLAAGCSKAPPPDEDPAASTAPAPPSAADRAAAAAKAKEIFAARCVPCHGTQGAGDGAASAGLTPKPRNFQEEAWHQSVDDAYIERIIKFGGTSVGKSPAMPGNPDLNDPTVVSELRTVVRGFKR